MASPAAAIRRVLSTSLAGELKDALVYLDRGAAEVAAAAGGTYALGAAALCDLHAASPGDLTTAALLRGGAPMRRVAILLTTLLAEAEAAVLAACGMHPAAAQFTLLCAASEAAHHDEAPAVYGPRCFAATSAAWQQQVNASRLAAGHGPCSLAIQPCPLLCLVPLTSAAFVLPAASAAAALPRAGRLPAGYSTAAAAAAAEEEDKGPSSGAAASSTGQGPQPRGGGGGAAPTTGFALLAHALVGTLSALGYRPEAFSLGPCSRLTASSMAFVPALAEDAQPAALVLIDRLLDPVSPALHADLLVQRLFDKLPPTEGGGSLDGSGAGAAAGARGGTGAHAAPFAEAGREVPMPSLDAPLDGSIGSGGGGGTGASGDGAAAAAAGGDAGAAAEGGCASLLPGTLRHPDDAQADRWLEFLLSRKGRDSPMFLRKWLREAARKENVPQTQRFKPGSVAAAELRALAGALRRQSPATAYRHSSLLQLAEAAAGAMEGGHAERWEALQREERQLLFACSESAGAAAAHLSELCQLAGRPGSPLGVCDVVLLLLAAHCLLPGFHPWLSGGGSGQAFQPQQEAQLQEALVEAVMCGAAAAAAEAAGADEELGGMRLEARDAVQALTWRLRQLSAFRASHLGSLAALAAEGPDGAPRRTPLLRRIAEAVLRDETLPKLRAGATSLSGAVRSALGRFGGQFGLQAGPKPSDCSTVILFVLGGISVAEVHEVMQAVEERAAAVAVAQAQAQAGGGHGVGHAAPRPPPHILVGGTALLRPGELCGHLFADICTA
ncbi:sec1 family domain-containing MIP3 [Micractinium conductrix]|uniref:Sec1 family domain-containing MIP3 n=1 Tax=Micractinium conductrix TaxID=554055 RepID=A0A2P6VIB0_9CHLO|nr:sec1 family domain-containing MIP3 [Micractinium conductrix]|eukprot:PSC73797.1 sec1 family domain-containing MIP3 [Micractinium conductrix]